MKRKFRKSPAPVRELRRALAILFPATFSDELPVPLAIGIDAEIRRAFPRVSKKTVRRFLHYWCRRTRYNRACLAPGAARYHLDGRPAGPVDAVGRFNARKALKVPRRLRLYPSLVPQTKKDGKR